MSSFLPHFCLCQHIATRGETLSTSSWTWKRAIYKWSLICQHKTQWCHKLDGISMGAPVEAPTASSSEVEHPTTNSVPELHGTPQTISSGRVAVSPEESNTKTQKPHDAIFMYKRALNTSLWKLWMATILFLQIKTNGIWRMKTNTMANEECWPHPPVVSDNKSARCRMSTNVNPSE